MAHIFVHTMCRRHEVGRAPSSDARSPGASTVEHAMRLRYLIALSASSCVDALLAASAKAS